MRILTTLPQDDLAEVPAAARAAEASGYDGLVTSENRNDLFLALGVAAVNTARVGLSTGVAIDEYCAASGRDPQSITRSLLCGFTPDRPFASLHAFHEFVGRCRAIGINEFIFYWLTDEGHPVFPDEGSRE